MRFKNEMDRAGSRHGNFAIILLVTLLAMGVVAAAQKKYAATGMILKVDKTGQTILVSCREIPGYMEAMVMPLAVRDPKALEGLEPGMTVEFSLAFDKDSSYAEDVHVRPFQKPGVGPDGSSTPKADGKCHGLKIARNRRDAYWSGRARLHFDRSKRNARVTLATQDRVVAVTFIYARCPLPNYCVRLANNLGVLQRRFNDRMGSELVLLTIIIDPVHDQPDALANYARTWKAEAHTWHFLTGSVSDIRQICHTFDMDFYPDEAELVHSFHTVVIDRGGKLAANLDGNGFTAQQLGDLVQTVMTRP